jgi:hypothetical protein
MLGGMKFFTGVPEGLKRAFFKVREQQFITIDNLVTHC